MADLAPDFEAEHMTLRMQDEGWSAWVQRWKTRRIARQIGRMRLPAVALSCPEPRFFGDFGRGQRLMAGVPEGADGLAVAPPWADARGARALVAAHGFEWLDDLMAVPGPAAQALAQSWCFEWIAQFGMGRGPGWAPGLTGLRLIRLLAHSATVLADLSPDHSATLAKSYAQCVARHVLFLVRRTDTLAPGLPRFEALCATVLAVVSLDGLNDVAPDLIDRALDSLARDCAVMIDAGGAIEARNPEELQDIFVLLVWVVEALEARARSYPGPILVATHRMAPTLRALRHSDGGLARFHGGGAGMADRLGHALAAAGLHLPGPSGLHMGFARLAVGRSSVIVDAAAPPLGEAALRAHASTLGFELTSGRRPVIISCGSGVAFGGEWYHVGRATAMHSTLAIPGYSSSRFARSKMGAKPDVGQDVAEETLQSVPQKVTAQRGIGPQGPSLIASHDGYVPTHGLTHVRRMNLSPDGRTLVGEDTLAAMTADDRTRFSRMLSQSGQDQLSYQLHFHLHPDVEPELARDRASVALRLISGEIWLFRAPGGGDILLEPSVFLETAQLGPRGTQQIILSCAMMDYASQTSWVLAKTQDTPNGLRDLVPDARLTLD